MMTPAHYNNRAIRINVLLPYVCAEADAQRGTKRWLGARGATQQPGARPCRDVERYLDLLSRPPKSDDQTPVLRMLRGAARGVPADAHQRHLSGNTGEASSARLEGLP